MLYDSKEYLLILKIKSYLYCHGAATAEILLYAFAPIYGVSQLL